MLCCVVLSFVGLNCFVLGCCVFVLRCVVLCWVVMCLYCVVLCSFGLVCFVLF